MKSSKAVDVSIMGRDFCITCPDEEREELLKAVAYLDKKMREIRDGGKVLGSERVAIMAALNITHELLIAREARKALTRKNLSVESIACRLRLIPRCQDRTSCSNLQKVGKFQSSPEGGSPNNFSFFIGHLKR